jgi:HAD superfamily hydrolase (TIGR01509 family)
MLEAVVFDFDGLILDTEMPEFTSWCEVFESHGHVLEFESWALGIGTRDGFDPYALLEELTAQTLDREAIRTLRRPRNLELLLDLPLMPGVLERLEEAESLGLRVGLASSADNDWVCGHLERFSLLNRFDAVICADGTLPAKPHPAVYERALADLGVAPAAAIAFEDSPNGIAAATAAGLYCIAVPNELTSRLDLSAADERITSLADVSLDRLAVRFTSGRAS